MLSDLVAGAGCDVTGENNALAKLSGAIYGGLEREYARREGEGSSSSAFAGPSSDSLPPMSEEEAAFRARFTGGPSEPAASTAVSGGYASGASGDVGFAEHRPPRWHPPHERSLPRGGFAPPPELALWESLRGEVEGLDGLASPPWGEEGGAAGAAEEQQYAFREPNPFLGAGGGREGLVQAGSELLGQGDLPRATLAVGCDLPQAILALEAAVRSEPVREASDSTQLDEAGREEARRESVAWQLLGQNLAALLALGVSYTNELDASRALDHLRLWLRRHPDFASLAPAEEEAQLYLRVGKGKYDVWARQADTTALFLRAVGRAPHSADLHAVLGEPHTALSHGVLHNLSREYGAAVSSFERALELRPEDYSLWNKLGATQANAMSCAAAVPCYVRALELRPNYVRALTNLGISYGNLSEQRAAAQCYLKALSLNQDAAHVWTYLTMVFSAMGRTDYVQMATATDLAALCAEFEV
ncbi:hypothetical protein EMIHUDRAFT_459060 [Emiliania huxleyi CCMP1516]|uniref:Peroxin-5 n=2 Tax=Emiliania huxleyi TaxID=2903 RepID=A0A0D3J0I6_EMIH1|nr:hypothetical protein EMIHUDRAFT_459060 [Emiliania huxleyi CCMP1516]EOD17021.1 hypothetical protein EMIHUDRAFT_459060 [Emiliania huxleyi CCMP1516]|eukprot:XP_005769450.1 hypothetical protein EMIHUDRAFT_459060 [Emiliania huxleyi CCMP1516]